MTQSDADQPVIVGKSVEEIEAETQNRVNSPVAGENRRDDDTPFIPAVPLGTASSGVVSPAPLIVGTETTSGALVNDADLVDHSGQPGDGRNDHQRDSSEE